MKQIAEGSSHEVCHFIPRVETSLEKSPRATGHEVRYFALPFDRRTAIASAISLSLFLSRAFSLSLSLSLSHALSFSLAGDVFLRRWGAAKPGIAIEARAFKPASP